MKASNYIKTTTASLALYGMIALGAVCAHTTMAHAAEPELATIEQTMVKAVKGDFIQKSKRLRGSYEVLKRDGQTIIRFADNFRTTSGPDLKVFLSPNAIEGASGKNATAGSVLLGFVKSTKGTQEYIVPAEVNIADFNSVLIHCEAFSVLWGGGNI